MGTHVKNAGPHGCKMSAHEIPDMKCRRTYPDVKCRRRQAIRINSIRIPPRGHARHAIRSNFIRIPSEGHVMCSPIRTPSGRSTQHSWTSHPDDNISYQDMLSGWKTLTKVSKPCYNPCSATLRWCVRTSLPWIPKNSPQSRIALVIKKLSKHQNLTQFD